MDFWAKTSGTWINVVTVVLGTTLGMQLNGRLPPRLQSTIVQSIGLVLMFVSLQMAGSIARVTIGRIDGTIPALVSLILGGLLGEWWQIEKRLEHLGDWLKARCQGTGKFTEAFVTASLLFCVGPMAIVGSLNNGLLGDNTLLVLKSTMDGIAAIAFTSSFGVGIGFSAVTILLYQGSLSLLAGLLARSLPDPATAPPVLLISGVGGLMLIGLGLNLLEVTRIRVASFLPALALAPMLYWLVLQISSLF